LEERKGDTKENWRKDFRVWKPLMLIHKGIKEIVAKRTDNGWREVNLRNKYK
jgi:hypothetical protein